MVSSWNQYLSPSPEPPLQVLSEFSWYNNYIKIEDAVMHFALSPLSENDRSYHGLMLKIDMN